MKTEVGFESTTSCQRFSKCVPSFKVHYTNVTNEQATPPENSITAARAALLRFALVEFSTPVNMQAAIGGAREASLAVSIHYRHRAQPDHYQHGQCSQPLGKRAGFIMGHSALMLPSVSPTEQTQIQHPVQHTSGSTLF